MFVDAPLHVFEQKAVKGLYTKRHRLEKSKVSLGLILLFSDTEKPEAPELVLKTDFCDVNDYV